MISKVAVWAGFGLGAAAMAVGVLGAVVAMVKQGNGGAAGFMGMAGAIGLGVLGLLTSIGALVAVRGTELASRAWWGLGLSLGAPVATLVLILLFVPRGAFRI
ncbi:MAG: hypothetical protein U0228_13945 [Myxococcaceae bacterium]